MLTLGVVQHALWVQGFEREASEMPQVAVSPQSLGAILGGLVCLAVAWFESAEIRMADRNLGREPTPAVTTRAGVF